VMSLDFSPDGRQVVTGSSDRKIRLWEVSTGRLLATLEGQQDEVVSVTFLPDGQRILACGQFRPARLWDITTGHQLPMQENLYELKKVVCSPSGEQLLI
jgi:WD40 repeat protein